MNCELNARKCGLKQNGPIMLLKRCEDVVAFVRNEKGGATGRGGEGELQFLERENRGGSCSLQRSVGPWGMFK